MGLSPQINKTKPFVARACNICGQLSGPDNYAPTTSPFYPDGYLPICNDCIDAWIKAKDGEWNWSRVDKVCQMADIPFIPKEWVKLSEMNDQGVFGRYARLFLESEYEGIGWDEYFQAYQTLKEEGTLTQELPELHEKELEDLRARWGGNYDEEALRYLDQLFNGILTTQNVNGDLQLDQARKICKLSYEIDCRIRGGDDFDKILTAYDRLVKTAEFTPKNVRNLNDFDSVGELVKWLEKRGWKNQYYDDVTKDIVDETIKNIQMFNQRLYTNESGIGDDIAQRIKQLQSIEGTINTNNDSYYLDRDANYDLDSYENDGYNELIKDQTFDPEA